MTNKAGHTFTAGPCEFHTQPYDCRSGIGLDHSIMDDGGVVTFVAPPGPANEEFQKRGHFIAEAFTVAHETGLTPRQLAEQCAEMLAVLELTQRWITTGCGPSPLFAVRAAISKATAGGAV